MLVFYVRHSAVECKRLRHINDLYTKLLFYGMFYGMFLSKDNDQWHVMINRIKCGGMKVTLTTLLAEFRLYIFEDIKAIS